MSSSTAVRAAEHPIRRRDRIAGSLFVLAGTAFVIGAATHPTDSGSGSKAAQLQDMLLSSMWYPSHTLLLVAMVAAAVAILRVRRWEGVDGVMAQVTRVVSVIAVISVLGMVLHLFSALGAEALGDGGMPFSYRLQALNETVVNASWGVGIAALALAGGVTRTLGNRVTLVFGLVGGLAYGLASATIAYTDRFDGLFPLGSLIAVWGVAVGLVLLTRADA